MPSISQKKSVPASIRIAAYRLAAPRRLGMTFADGPLSPLAAKSDLCFETDAQETHGFRLISGAMCLSQALVVSLGLHQAESQS